MSSCNNLSVTNMTCRLFCCCFFLPFIATHTWCEKIRVIVKTQQRRESFFQLPLRYKQRCLMFQKKSFAATNYIEKTLFILFPFFLTKTYKSTFHNCFPFTVCYCSPLAKKKFHYWVVHPLNKGSLLWLLTSPLCGTGGTGSARPEQICRGWKHCDRNAVLLMLSLYWKSGAECQVSLKWYTEKAAGTHLSKSSLLTSRDSNKAVRMYTMKTWNVHYVTEKLQNPMLPPCFEVSHEH